MRYDLCGRVFGRLTVISDTGKRSPRGNKVYLCRCECGEKCEAMTTALTRGSKKSCGCYHRDSARYGPKAVKHGMHATRTYKTWMAMRHRCISPNDTSYPYYGARGVEVCERWLSSFSDFYADMGERPRGMTIERIDSNGNYEPGNCKWATAREQAANRRNGVYVQYEGARINMAEFARVVGMSYDGAAKRAKREGLICD